LITLQDYIDRRDTSKHKCKTEQEAVNEAIDILLNNRFTGVDIVTLITADRDTILQVLNDRVFPNGIQNKRPEPRG